MLIFPVKVFLLLILNQHGRLDAKEAVTGKGKVRFSWVKNKDRIRILQIAALSIRSELSSEIIYYSELSMTRSYACPSVPKNSCVPPSSLHGFGASLPQSCVFALDAGATSKNLHRLSADVKPTFALLKQLPASAGANV